MGVMEYRDSTFHSLYFSIWLNSRKYDFSDLKAVSQNLGHASISTTDQIYSILSNDDVKEKITGISQVEPKPSLTPEEDKIKRIMETLNE